MLDDGLAHLGDLAVAAAFGRQIEITEPGAIPFTMSSVTRTAISSRESPPR
jgi:hypothetical protein